MTSPAYRYILTDLITDQVLAVLPLTGVSFSRAISRPGSFTGTLNATTPELVQVAKLAYRQTGAAALWVERDGAIWWGGIVWTTQVGQSERGPVQLQLQAATFDSYAHRRILYVDKTYTQVGQNLIVKDLWDTMQAMPDVWPAANIGVDTSNITTPGTPRDRTYKVSDLNDVGKLIEDLGDVIGGPEHTILTYYSPEGDRVKELVADFRIGLTEPRHVFQRVARGGGRIVSWGHTNDATLGATNTVTRGDAPNGNVGEDVDPLMSAFWVSDASPTSIDAGWPLYVLTADYPGVSDKDTLDQYAQAMLQQAHRSVATSAYTIEVGNSGWNPNRLGDAVRLKLTDDWHDNDDLTVRPVGCTVTPPEKGRQEQIVLAFEDETNAA